MEAPGHLHIRHGVNSTSGERTQPAHCCQNPAMAGTSFDTRRVPVEGAVGMTGEVAGAAGRQAGVRHSAARRAGAMFGVVLASSMVLAAAVPTRSAAEVPGARLFAAHALALRAEGADATRTAAEVLALMPGSGRVRDELLPLLWGPFFENAIVQLGRLGSRAPVALYYNPLLDVAVLARWEREGEGYRVASVRALPGERLGEPGAASPLLPEWMGAGDGALDALVRIAAARLAVFRREHPAEESTAGNDGATFASAAGDMRTVLPRLVWNAASRAQWTEEMGKWLQPALAGVEAALDARDSGAVAAAAPETDAQTAETLAALPPAFASRLALDMVLPAGERERLLIGSLPEDGALYVFVQCRLGAEACALRRFSLLSVSG